MYNQRLQNLAVTLDKVRLFSHFSNLYWMLSLVEHNEDTTYLL